MMSGKKVELHCIHDCTLVLDGSTVKRFKYGDTYRFTEEQANALLTANKRKFVKKEGFKEFKKLNEKLATDRYEDSKKKENKSVEDVKESE